MTENELVNNPEEGENNFDLAGEEALGPSTVEPSQEPESPRWPGQAKLVVGLVITTAVVFLLVRFHTYLTMVLAAMLVAFLFHPLAKLIQRGLKLNWRLSVGIVYLFFALVLGGLITRGGASLVNLIQDLVKNLDKYMAQATNFLATLSNRVLMIGPLQFTIPDLNTDFIASQLISRLQPLLTQAGTLAGKLVTSVGSTLFNFAIIYMVSFFLASESSGAKMRVFNIAIPGYEKDIKRMGREVSNIWNAFMRGEFVVVGVAIAVYSVVLGIFGLPYFFLLAIVAGLGRFVPYVGAWVGWLAFGIAALLKTPTPFGLANWAFALVIIGIALLIDTVLDNLLTPRVMGNALEVHPAAIMISALIGAQILGLIGVILAAPVYATIKLVFRYVLRKLMDQEPWEGISYYKPKKRAMFTWLRKYRDSAVGQWLRKAWGVLSKWLAQLWSSVKTFFHQLKARVAQNKKP